MSDTGGKERFVRIVTHETLLFSFRSGMIGLLTLACWWLGDLKNDSRELRRDFVEFKLAEAERLAKVEGQVSGLVASVEVHRKRLEGNDTDIRSIWSRIFDMSSRLSTKTLPSPPP